MVEDELSIAKLTDSIDDLNRTIRAKMLSDGLLERVRWAEKLSPPINDKKISSADEPQTIDELIKNLPGERGDKQWWIHLNNAYNDPVLQQKLRITQRLIADKTGYGIRHVQRHIKKVPPRKG